LRRASTGNLGMADRISEPMAAQLREKLGRFLDRRVQWKRPLLRFIDTVASQKWDAVIFGGALRDLMWPKLSLVPRDIDIVVAGISLDEMQPLLRQFLVRKTRFGGLHLNVTGWECDVWPLEDTWGFKAANLEPTFENLPLTTFLNVEAVAISLIGGRGHARTVYDHGFFRAMKDERIDINFEPNPFPLLCVVRAIITAVKLQFSLSHRLAEYISRYSTTLSEKSIAEIQQSHYGRLLCRPIDMMRWIEHLNEQVQMSRRPSYKLRVSSDRQLELWRR
jgi:hypothetical protein